MDFRVDAPPELLVPGQVLLLEASPGRKRRAVLQSWLDSAQSREAQGRLLDCHFDHGGPWAGVADLFQDLALRIEPTDWDLLVRHDYELVSILPLLRSRLSPRNPTLTDIAGAREQVRLYPADRALRILHGLIDLWASWKERFEPSPAVLICDNFDRAGHLVRRFFAELVRRIGRSRSLSLVIACAPGTGSAFHAAFTPETRGRTLRLSFKPEPDDVAPAGEMARRAQEIEDRIVGDALAMEAHLPALIRLWTLSETPERALPWQFEAFSVYTSRGFYLDSISYGEGALAHLRRFHPEDESRRWKIVNKLFACHCAAGHPETALAVVEETLDSLRQPSLRALAHYVLAMLHARYLPDKNLALAEEHLEIGIADLHRAGLSEDELHFQVAFNRNGLALVRHFQGSPVAAIALCKEGFAGLHDHLREDQHRLHRSVLLYNIAQVYSSLGQYDEAVHHFTAAMEMDPHYSEYYNDRGNLHLKKGHLDKALADYLRALELSAPFAEVRANLGQCYFKLSRIPEALAAFSGSLDLDPTQPGLLVMRARCHEALGLLSEAIADYTASLALNPHQPLVLANRACLHYESGRVAEALADLDEAVTGAPESAEIYQNRAVALADLGRPDEAVHDLETYLRLRPDAEDRADVASQIEALRFRQQVA